MKSNNRKKSDQLEKTYGTNLPGANRKPKRTMKEWEARASVLAAGRSGAIKEMPKTKGGLTGKVVLEKKKDFTKRQMNSAKKGK